MVGQKADGRTTSRPVLLRLLGGFSIEVAGEPVDVTPASQKLLAVVALLGGAAHRSRVASTIWPDSGEDRALANLRGAIWRIDKQVRPEVERHGMSLSLSRSCAVDVDQAVLAERRLRAGECLGDVDRSLFSRDLLPDWDAEWLLVLRERHRQLRLHALEALAQADLDQGRPLDAVDTAFEAVSAEPLRESAQLLLLEAHLAAGNRAAVIREYGRFETLLGNELGVRPSERMRQVVVTAKASRPL